MGGAMLTNSSNAMISGMIGTVGGIMVLVVIFGFQLVVGTIMSMISSIISGYIFAPKK